MFALTAHEASIANINQRIERHGEDRALAVDIKFSMSTANNVLDHFDKGLREALFRKPGKGEQQDLPINDNPLTAVKFPALEAQRLAHEFSGYELQIDGLLDATQPIILVDVKLKKFVADPKEGGSVELSFTASANVEPDELSELGEALVREDVRITLVPPSKQAEQLPEAA